MSVLKSIALPVIVAVLFAGCTSTNDYSQEIKMPQTQQNTYLSHARPPQQFGFSVVSAKGGISYRGSCRLHPNHSAVKKMERKGVPIIEIQGRSSRSKMKTLVDFSSPSSWMEFSTSRDFGLKFMGIDDMTIPYRGGYNTGGVNAYAAVATHLRVDQHLFMENVPFYVRMAMESIGPLARGIRSPRIDSVMGYDNLRNFEFVQFNFKHNTIAFSATQPYTPDKTRLTSTAIIVDLPGHGLAVEGFVLEKVAPIVLDPAGLFSFARGDAKVSVTSKVAVGGLPFFKVPTLVLPAHNAPPRIGRKLLEPYIVTICNKKGLVYFELHPK